MTEPLASRLIGAGISATVVVALVSVPLCFAIIAATYPTLHPDVATLHELLFTLPGFVWALALVVAARRHPGWFGLPLLVAAFVAGNAVMVATILTVDTIPVSDPAAIWQTAELMSRGQFSASAVAEDYYLNIFNWKLGIAAFEALVMKLFVPDMRVFQMLAILLVNLSALMLWRLGRRHLGSAAACGAVVAFLTYYPVLVTAGQFCDQQLAVPLILGILMLLESRTLWRWCVAGVLIALLNFVRPVGILLVLTALVWLLWSRGPGWGRMVLGAACLVCWLLMAWALNAAMMRADWATRPLDSANLPYFKFDRGLTGFYGDIDLSEMTLAEFSHMERERVAHYLRHRPGDVALYVATKMVRYQGEFDYRVENTYNHDSALWGRAPVKQLIMVGWGQYVGLAIAGAVGFGWALRGRRRVMAPWLIFYAGNFAVYFFIEAFTGYRYEGYPLLMLLAALAMESGGAGVLKNH